MGLSDWFFKGENRKTRLIYETVFLFFNLFIILALGSKFFLRDTTGIFGFLDSPTGEMRANSGIRMNILCIGVDSVDGTHRTDAILLIGLKLPSGKISIASIPRDTQVVIEGRSRKINEIYARYGIEMLRMLVEELMEIRIARFVKVDFDGFKNVINALGGIDLHIDHPMNYDDNWGNLHIHFSRGPAHLDGQKALEYVRYRGDADADLGRIKRQRDFISAVLKKVHSPEFVLRLPEILREIFLHISTDFDFPEVLQLAKEFNGRNVSVQSQSLPGEAKYVGKVSYYIPFKDQAISLGGKWFSELTTFEVAASFSARIEPKE